MVTNIAIDGPAGARQKYDCQKSGKRIVLYLCGHWSDVPGYGPVSVEKSYPPRRFSFHGERLSECRCFYHSQKRRTAGAVEW